MEGEAVFVEDDMPRDDDVAGGTVQAMIAFVVRGVAQEGTRC